MWKCFRFSFLCFNVDQISTEQLRKSLEMSNIKIFLSVSNSFTLCGFVIVCIYLLSKLLDLLKNSKIAHVLLSFSLHFRK